MAVHEDQARAGQFREGESGQRIARKAIDARIENRLERELRNRRDVGEAPVLVLEGGESQFGKARDAGFAHREQPGGLAANAGLLEALEGLQERIDLFCRIGGLGGSHGTGHLRCVRRRRAGA